VKGKAHTTSYPSRQYVNFGRKLTARSKVNLKSGAKNRRDNEGVGESRGVHSRKSREAHSVKF